MAKNQFEELMEKLEKSIDFLRSIREYRYGRLLYLGTIFFDKLDSLIREFIIYTYEYKWEIEVNFKKKIENKIVDLKKDLDYNLSNPQYGTKISLDRIQLVFKKQSYKSYFKKIKENVIKFEVYLKELFFLGLEEVINEKGYGEWINSMLKLSKELNEKLKDFEKNIKKRLESSLSSIEHRGSTIANDYNNNESKLRSAVRFAIQRPGYVKKEFEVRQRLLEPRTFDGEIHLLGMKINYIKKYYENFINAIEKIRSVYNEKYIKYAPGFDKIDYDLFKKAQNELKRLERDYNFLKEFEKAYYKDDQELMYKTVKDYLSKGSRIEFTLIGTKSKYKAYAGVQAYHRKDRTWVGMGNTDIEPEYYAGRLKDIMNKGYEPSFRELNGNILGVSKIGNVYFYVNRAGFLYGNACISWDLDDYCVFTNRKNEYFILSRKNIPLNRIKLLLKKPTTYYNKKLVEELQRLGVPFEYI